ncbi:mitogen-activated protein kinase kinase kinase 7-like [Octopus sinensis]|uniref:Mitogen-activated protein kinase kinase kinase 7-like n=1 Tax=Octopus sinensis TaxID=2607531 RepID=A0A7E6FJA6_9MOLL|nr:mitogen-activated protein kinase kinase kinase 7-like [Octopus sinensis]
MLPYTDLINGQASGPTSTSRSNSPVKPLQHGNSLSDMVSHPSAANVEQMYPFPVVDTTSYDNIGLNSNSYLMQLDRLEQQHQPLTPYPTCKDSMDIYNEHILLAQKYIKAKINFQYLMQKKKELIEDYGSGDTYISEKERDLRTAEYNNLKLLSENLRKQVQQLKKD